jgi:apolipoprotein N-acyltransferase
LLGLGGRPATGRSWPSLRTAFCHAAVWAGLEWLRGWLFTGFGWNGLGVAFHETAVIAQAADLLGATGLSLLLVFFQAVLILTGRRIWEQVRDGKRRSRWDFIAAAAVVALTVAYGLVRGAVEQRRESVRLKALLVQLNIPQDAAVMHWDDLEIHQGYENDTLEALAALDQANEQALQKAMTAADEGTVPIRRPDWVIWPESAMRGRLLRTDGGAWGMFQGNMDTLAAIRTGGEFELIFGATELEGAATDDGGILPKSGGAHFNSLVAVSPDNDLQSYRKNHLVIFGETIPFVDSLPFLKAIYEQQSGAEYGGSFSPGGSFEPLVLPVGANRVGIIPSVCFEDTVPRLKRRFVRPGPQVIVNITNDGWFRESVAAAQHFANARFRAIELRRPMLRCANTGVSAAVDHTGSTAHPDHPGEAQVIRDARGSHFTRKSLLVELDVPLRPATTLYALIGDWGIIVLALLGLALSIPARNPKPPPSAKPPGGQTAD